LVHFIWTQKLIPNTIKILVMNQIKKLAGIIWLLLGPASIYFIVRAAAHEIAVKPGVDTVIQWGVFVVIFIPIAIGMSIFGYYAIKGEYNH